MKGIKDYKLGVIVVMTLVISWLQQRWRCYYDFGRKPKIHYSLLSSFVGGE